MNNVNQKNNNFNAFAVELYNKIAPQDGNAIFSPSNIATMLGMLHRGAVGKTAEALEETLRTGLANGDLQNAFKDAVASKPSGVVLNISNALWVQEGVEIKEEYKNSICSDYCGVVETLDFRTDTEASRQRINQVVKDQTGGMIEELFEEGSLSSSTVATLTAAIYFQGLWETQFEERYTCNEFFTLKSGEMIEAPFMRLIRAENLRYYTGRQIQAVELPYQGGEMHMLLITSVGENNSLAALEKILSVDNLELLSGRMKEQSVTVWLPKFKVSSDFKLRKTLEEMGMSVFGSRRDFSSITEKHLGFSDIVHKAVVEVDEKGTKAAAATGLSLESRSFAREFNGRQPFMFFIRDRGRNIYFMGKVENPTQA